ncbi:MAG: hypothetical protein ACRDOB_05480, partial [Streptosporangiaceae bacterium]
MITEPDLPERGPHWPGAWPRTATARRWAVDAAIALAVTAAQVGGVYAWHRHGDAAGPVVYLASAVGGVS